MKGLLTWIVAPVAAAAGLVGVVATAAGLGWISDEVAFWLWPTLFAVLFLLASVFVLLRGAKLWLWPLATGFVVQTVGLLLLLLTGVFEDDRWRPLWYTLGAVAIVLAVMLAVWAISTIRARLLEKKLAEGAGGSQEDRARLRKDMTDALDLLRRAGRGRNAIYDLPWFLVMGRPAAGKTVLIKNSELGLPVKRDWVKGVGGTYTADWFFTNDLIFLDTPGKWVTEGATDEGREHWGELIRLLRKYRGRQPLDGLIVVVPADDLLRLSSDELEEQAANIREVVDLIHKQLQFRFPVYVLVSKCDLVEGFVDFFKGLPAQRRHEILGWSNPDPNDRNVAGLIRKGFGRVHRRLENYRLEMLGRVAKRSQARRLFFFTEEFRELEQPLSVFTEALFAGDRYSEPPVFRGFYFTSGTQEGAPLSKAIQDLARTLGVPAVRSHEVEEEEQKRSYFLRDLFRELMIGDESLVGRTAGHWWRRRRNTIVGVFAPAGVAVLLLLFAGIALALNRGTYGRIEDRSPQIVSELDHLAATADLRRPDTLEQALGLTAQLRSYHVQLAGFQPFRGFGMRRPRGLDGRLYDLYRSQLLDVALAPTLAEASRMAASPDVSCVDRIDVLRSVVWLRTGRRAGFEHLAGLDPVWGLDDAHGREQAQRLRRELRRQYVYLANHVPADEAGALLPEFSVREVARSIRDVCGKQGATSTLELYRRWQESCRQVRTPSEITGCYAELNKVLRNAQLDYGAFRDRFEQLKTDLEALRGDVPEAKIGLEMLADLDLAEQQTEQCLTSFDRNIVPPILEYAVRQDLVDECRLEVDKADGKGAKYTRREEVLREQAVIVEPVEKNLGLKLIDFNTVCQGAVPGFHEVELRTLVDTVNSYRRVACLGQEVVLGELPSEPPAAGPIRTSAPPQAPRSAPLPARRSRYEWFETPRAVSSEYLPENFGHKREDWGARLEAIRGAGYNAAQSDYETGQLRAEIASYASSYSGAWLQYLRSVTLQAPTPPIADWIDRLSKSKEFEQLIGVARAAAAIGAQATEPPFDVVAAQIRPIEGLSALAIGDYQALLGAVAADLKRCEKDPVQWQAYRQQIRSGDLNNALVRARDWIDRHAGPSLAEGSLRKMLERPLDEAQAYVESDSLIKRQWEDLVALYDSGIRGRAPFSGDLGDEPVTLKNLRALLGGQTGAVARVRRAAASATLAPEVDAWIGRAEMVSRLLFGDESDDPRPIKINVTVGEETYEPDEFGKGFRLGRVTVYFGEGDQFDWEIDAERTRPIELNVFGDQRSEFAYVEGGVAERKNVLFRAIGKKWKPGEGLDAGRAEGPLAPLKLLALGRQDQGSADLRYTIQVEWKKDNPGTVRVPIRLSGRDAEPLIDLMRRGLEPPPRRFEGN